MAIILDFVDNATETVSGSVALPDFAEYGTFFHRTVPKCTHRCGTCPSRGSQPGAVEVITLSSFTITATYPVPSARYIALSPSGQFLLVFADDSDSVFLINLSATTPAPVEIPGFARPVNAFFSSDSNTAYVISCGVECGSTSGASVQQLDIPSQTIKATVPVGGASVGLLNSGTLYVAGNPGPAGTYDAVDVSYHDACDRQLGCHRRRLSQHHGAVDQQQALHRRQHLHAMSPPDVCRWSMSPTTPLIRPLPPRGAVTGMLAISGRNTVYVIEGGYQVIYDTTTDTPQKTQVTIHGCALRMWCRWISREGSRQLSAVSCQLIAG